MMMTDDSGVATSYSKRIYLLEHQFSSTIISFLTATATALLLLLFLWAGCCAPHTHNHYLQSCTITQ
jgi:hypothetical protein